MNEPSDNASITDGNGFDCSHLFRQLCGHKFMLVGWMGLFLLAGLAYLAVVPALYQATTIVGLHGPGADLAEGGRAGVDEMVLKTTEQNFRRVSIYRRVVARDEFRDALFSGEPDGATFQQGVERLAGRTRVRWQRGTSLIFITVTDEEQELAKRLAGALVAEFALDQVERGREGDQVRLGRLKEASEALQKRLHEHREMARAIHEKGQSGEVSILAYFEQQQAKGGDFWKGLDLDELSGLAEEKRRDVVLKYARARAEVLEVEIDSERRVLAGLMGEIEQLELSLQLEEAGIRVVEPAFVLPGTAGPGWASVVLASVFLGFTVGLVSIWCKGVCLGGK